MFRYRPTPIIYQAEAAECGLACLAMIANYHGHNLSLVSLRMKFGSSPRGMTLSDIIDTADALKFSSRPIKLDLDEIRHLTLPAIAHWDLSHFVVITAISDKSVTIHDPARGYRKLPIGEFSKSFTGIALEITPQESFVPIIDRRKLKISHLWRTSSGLGRGIIQLIMFSLFIQIAVLISPIFLQLVIDDVIGSNNYDALLVISISFAGVYFAQSIVTFIRNLLVVHVGANVGMSIGSNLFKHMLSLPVSFFQKRHMGDVVSRFQSLLPVRRLLTEGAVGIFIDGFLTISTLLLMLFYDVSLAFIAIFATCLILLSNILSYPFLVSRNENALAHKAEENSLFMESLRGLTTLKLFSGEGFTHRKWANLFAQSVMADGAVQKLKGGVAAFKIIVQGLEIITLVAISANLIHDGNFTVGMLFAFMAYRTNFSDRANALIDRLVEFKMLDLHLDRLSDLVFAESEDKTAIASASLNKKISGQISIRSLGYSYNRSETRIIDNLSLEVKAGESIAIIGPSGCGKTTLLNLLTSLIEPDAGDIILDDAPLKSLGISAFRRQIGVVTQEDKLLSGSIADNITFFNPDAKLTDIATAAFNAGIFEEIQALPMQFDTLVGDMGTSLSGGQKQRLAIARALYKKPQILFMDEGTSHLDIGTEQIINSNLSALNITRIIVAHRPETIKQADRVLLLADGNLQEVVGEVSLNGKTIKLDKKSPKFADGGGKAPPPEADSGSTKPLMSPALP